MYNAFIVRKKRIELEDIRKKSEANTRHIQRYYQVTRPALLESHGKKINSFIRKMEEEPLFVSEDPYTRPNASTKNQEQLAKKRSFSQMDGSRSYSHDAEQKQMTFKFKDIEDWRSLLTPFERIERRKNFQLFKQKYGDPSIAYRSIGSQSEYKPGHEFRQRSKDQEINPPMRYTNKPTQQILARLKSKYKNRQKENQEKNVGNSKQLDALVRRNTSSSLNLLGQDLLISDNNTERASREQSDKESGHEAEQPNLKSEKKQKKKPLKMHFKELMDLEQNITDPKTKKSLREILYRCGVYRKKNRRAVTDSDVDQLSQFIDTREH